jgi:hypothetical protein
MFIFQSALILDFRHLKDVEDGDTLSFRQLYKWGGSGDIFDFI